MRAPRLLLLAAGAALLTGCGLEQPTPYVSVVSGGSFEASEASFFCFEGQDPAAEEGAEGACTVFEDHEPAVVEATPGEVVGVDVAQELAEEGWQVTLAPDGEPQQGQEPQRTPVLKDEHYFSFPAGFGEGGAPLRLTVSLVEEDGAAPRGGWDFLIVPRVG